MKIAIITNGLLPVPSVKGGGVETLIQQFIDTNEEKGIFDIDIYSIYDQDAKKKSKLYKKSKFIFLEKGINNKNIINSLKWRLFKIPSFPEQYNTKKMIDQVKNSKYDVIVFENTFTEIRNISRVHNGKIYLHIHNDMINNDKSYWHKKELKSIIDKCDKVITVSQFIKNRILEIENISPNKISVLKNCTYIEKSNIQIKDSEITEIKKKYNINNDDIVIFFSGRIVPEKGVLELVSAIKLLKMNSNIKLIIAGDISNNDDIYIKQIKRESEDILDKVIFTGFLGYKDLHKLRHICHIGVVPSLWDEPGALVVMEAMASGLPLIATNSGGIPEYTNEKCTILIDKDKDVINNLSKALDTLINDKSLRNSMGKEGKKHVQQFSIDNYYYKFAKTILDGEEKYED